MAKAVLATKVDPAYDDLPEERYHFPRAYLRAMETTVGDWVIYYEPRRTTAEPSSRGGRQAYFAIARVARISPDSIRADHFYALVSDYLELDSAVPFKEGGHYYEGALRRSDGATNKGAFGRAVRPISDNEFDLIVRAGFVRTLGAVASDAPREGANILGLSDEPATFDRPVIERVVSRPFRDAAFSAAVRSAYGETCAMTGLRIINGGGRPEVQAAHIRPVADRGPDSVRNGMALSGTVHWMFDRGLVSVDENYRIVVAEDRVPPLIAGLLPPGQRIHLPKRPELAPHPQFLRFHRQQVFKG